MSSHPSSPSNGVGGGSFSSERAMFAKATAAHRAKRKAGAIEQDTAVAAEHPDAKRAKPTPLDQSLDRIAKFIEHFEVLYGHRESTVKSQARCIESMGGHLDILRRHIVQLQARITTLENAHPPTYAAFDPHNEILWDA
jgi:hypothetical protein